jgi:hypothetical protein
MMGRHSLASAHRHMRHRQAPHRRSISHNYGNNFQGHNSRYISMVEQQAMYDEEDDIAQRAAIATEEQNY